jgi:hypothetical protein
MKHSKKAIQDLEDTMEFKESLNKLYQEVLQWLIKMEVSQD